MPSNKSASQWGKAKKGRKGSGPHMTESEMRDAMSANVRRSSKKKKKGK